MELNITDGAEYNRWSWI